jgi:hypothetical protein
MMMKPTKIFILSAGLAVMLGACGQRGAQAGSAEVNDSTATAAGSDSIENANENIVSVETVKYEKSDSTAEVYILVQWPMEGNKALVDSLRHHIANLLESEIDGPKAIETYGESLFESLSEDWHSVYDEMEPEARMGAFSKTHDITVLAETDRYITYHYQTYMYGGGAHGYTTEVGFTFRKSDGRQIPLLTETESPQLASLIKEGVRGFFSGEAEKPYTDEELLEFLFIEEVSALNHIPLPVNPPYLTKTGLVMLYTQYEIGPYSSGIISFEIPFDKIRPFLTTEAKALIE